MSFFGGLFKGVAALVVSVLAFGIFSGKSVPSASFTMTPDGNPVVGQKVQFLDASTGSPTSWSWNFGDGQTSTLQSPTHVFNGPGSVNVTLTATNADGATVATQPAFVSPKDTLRLNIQGNHPFTVTLTATDPRTNHSGPGQAIPQNDLFGYFSIPALTFNPDNPEVFVKILDGTSINGQYWVFFGHLTDLAYDITVTEVATGFIKIYHKDPGNAVGGFDTSGFHATATPTQTPIVTATPTPTVTPTATPTAPALTVTNLVATDFQWNFDGNGPEFTMRVGQAYQIRISRANGAHQFTGLQKGVSPFNDLGCGPSNFPTVKTCNITPTTANIGDYFFGCSVSTCGSGHSFMQNGKITVLP